MKSLILLFTYNTSLSDWKQNGSIDRELNNYKKLLTYFDKIYFVTYGEDDFTLQKYLPENIIVLPKKYSLPNLLYSFVLPFAYRKHFENSLWIKTNQMMGSWVAVLSKILFKKKIFIRTGYTESLSYINKKFFQKLFIHIIEYLAYKTADMSSVTSSLQLKYIKRKYSPNNITLIPNGIDITLFKPLNNKKYTKPTSQLSNTSTRLLFIGRLHHEKNVINLLKSLKGLENVVIKIIGKGPLKKELKRLSVDYSVNVEFIDKVPNSELPKIYNQADIYIQPSLYEGNPKTILEAMACGLPIIASDVPGINNIIKHKESGYLCNTNIKSIKDAIINLQNDLSLRLIISKNARKYIVEKYNLSTILKQEIQLYKTHTSQ